MPTCGDPTSDGTPCNRRTDGGAPKGNFNAGIHAGFSDWRKHYDRLGPDVREWVDNYADSLITRSKADLPDSEIEAKARETGTLAHMWRCASADSFKRGWVLESEETHEPTGKTYTIHRLNAALRADLAISRRKRALARELRVYRTPDGLPHSEQ